MYLNPVDVNTYSSILSVGHGKIYKEQQQQLKTASKVWFLQTVALFYVYLLPIA